MHEKQQAPLKGYAQAHLPWVRHLLSSFPLQVFFFSRLGYVTFSWMSLTAVNTLWYHDDSRHRVLQPYPFIDGLCRWDCGWFHNLVMNGYANPEYAKVFPLLAVIGGAVERALGINHLVVFILVANGCAAGAYVIIYRLFRDLEGEEAARQALLLFAAFPFAYYSAAGYPESVMMLTTAGAIVLARRRQHLSGGLLLTVGFAARHLTLAGGAGLLAAQIRQRGLHPKRLLVSPAVLGLLMPWAFLAGFSLYLGRAVGDPLAWWTSRKINWDNSVWYGAREIIQHVSYDDRPEYYYYLLFALPVVAGGAGLAWALYRRRWEYAEIAAYGLVLLAVVLGSGAAGMGRYLASIWPCFLPLGVWLSRRPALQGPVLGFSWLLQGMWFFLFTHQWRVL